MGVSMGCERMSDTTATCDEERYRLLREGYLADLAEKGEEERLNYQLHMLRIFMGRMSMYGVAVSDQVPMQNDLFYCVDLCASRLDEEALDLRSETRAMWGRVRALLERIRGMGRATAMSMHLMYVAAGVMERSHSSGAGRFPLVEEVRKALRRLTDPIFADEECGEVDVAALLRNLDRVIAGHEVARHRWR
jgi:hypothetical protein